MAERKSAKAAASSSSQTGSDVPLQGIHTPHTCTHLFLWVFFFSSSLMRELDLSVVCYLPCCDFLSHITAFLHIWNHIYVFLKNNLSPQERLWTFVNRKDNSVWFSYTQIMLTSEQLASQSLSFIHQALILFTVSHFAKSHRLFLTVPSNYRKKEKRCLHNSSSTVTSAGVYLLSVGERSSNIRI